MQLRTAKNVAQHKIVTLLNTGPHFPLLGNSAVEMNSVDDIIPQYQRAGHARLLVPPQPTPLSDYQTQNILGLTPQIP